MRVPAEQKRADAGVLAQVPESARPFSEKDQKFWQPDRLRLLEAIPAANAELNKFRVLQLQRC